MGAGRATPAKKLEQLLEAPVKLQISNLESESRSDIAREITGSKLSEIIMKGVLI